MITPHPKTEYQTTHAPCSTSDLTLKSPPRPTSGTAKATSRETLWPGRPDLMERFEARFWDRVDGSGGPDSCWPWTGPVNKTNRYGYVTFWNGRKSRGIGAHRVAYVLAVGPVPVDLLVCHECDYRICCNPAHLWVGTYKDNGRDMAVKGRDAMMKLNPGKVRQIRARYAEGGVSQRELAGEYGVARAHISGVISGKFWGHVA